MDFASIFTALQDTAFATTIRETGNWFPWIESFHVIFVMTVVGTIWIVDLRLLGVAWNGRPISHVTNELLPYTWGAFVLATISGLALFTTRAVVYTGLFLFQFKMVLLMLAGLNMLLFHFVISKDQNAWDGSTLPPFKARLVGGLSLLFWLGIIICGRWIGFAAEL